MKKYGKRERQEQALLRLYSLQKSYSLHNYGSLARVNREIEILETRLNKTNSKE